MGLRRYEPSISTVGEAADLESMSSCVCVRERVYVSDGSSEYLLLLCRPVSTFPHKSIQLSPKMELFHTSIAYIQHINLPTLLAERTELQHN